MTNVEIDDDEIVDAIIARPELVLRAFEQIKACADSLAKHHQRWVRIAAMAASGMSAGTAETQSGSGRKPASPTAEGGDAPKASPKASGNPGDEIAGDMA